MTTSDKHSWSIMRLEGAGGDAHSTRRTRTQSRIVSDESRTGTAQGTPNLKCQKYADCRIRYYKFSTTAEINSLSNTSIVYVVDSWIPIHNAVDMLSLI